MAEMRKEVRSVVIQMISNLKQLAEKDPQALIGSAFKDYNSLLRRAKQTFPDSPTIKEMEELKGSISALDLLMKLSALDAATGGH